MTPTQAAEILAKHNEWRRHDDHNSDHAPPEQECPKKVGKAIDVAVQVLRQLDAEVVALRKDAERYRSLNWHWEDARDMAPGGRWWLSVNTTKGNLAQGPDAAIDAAMKEQT